MIKSVPNRDEEYFAAQATHAYFKVNAQRAIGELPEKESTKAAAAIARLNEPDASVFLDAGCSSGHLLKSLLTAGLEVKKYVGVDLDEPAIAMARSTWAKSPEVESSFHVASVSEMPLEDQSVDVSISLNVLEHMRSVRPTLDELIRVTRRLIIIRTSVWESTYIIQEVRNSQDWRGDNTTYSELPPPEEELNADGDPREFVYQNMWGRSYLEAQIQRVSPGASMLIEPDVLFTAEALESDIGKTGLPCAAKVVNGRQVVGPLSLPHCWILIRLDGGQIISAAEL